MRGNWGAVRGEKKLVLLVQYSVPKQSFCRLRKSKAKIYELL